MSLETEVTNRYALERLIQLTNPGAPDETTIDAARLALAAADAKAEFRVRVGVDLDETDAQHIDAGVLGVVCKLIQRTGNPVSDTGPCRDWREALESLRAQVGGGARLRPRTNAVQIPTAESATDVPKFDSSHFDEVNPK